MRLNLIAALNNQGAIGANGEMLWHHTDMPSDMKYFRDITRGHIVIMGRKTWDSLSVQPLPNRINIVISTTLGAVKSPWVYVVSGIEEALELAKQLTEKADDKNVFCIGGGTLYHALINIADALWLTHVFMDAEGDTYFPPLDERDWKTDHLSNLPIISGKDKYPFTFKYYSRIR